MGTAFVPLKKVVQDQFQSWPIQGLDEKNIGQLELQIYFHNEDMPSLKRLVQEKLHHFMLNLTKKLFKGNFPALPVKDKDGVEESNNNMEKLVRIEYGVLISESQKSK